MDFVAGHNGMVGSALVRRLQASDDRTVVTRTRRELDLTRQEDVESFFADTPIDTVYLAAARVGGIKANSEFPADFIRENLQIQTNIIDSAHRAGVSKLLFLGSSCIYPRMAEQPMSEQALMTGTLEPTNDAYAVAKIAGIKMCEAYRRQFGSDFRSVMPTNLYGPGDNFDLDTSHVLPALLRKFHEAAKKGETTVTVWGSGRPRREFLHVDDMASACSHLMTLSEDIYWNTVSEHCSHVNVGCGSDISIADLAELIAKTTGFGGRIEYDSSMPDGTPRKLLDVSRMESLGWSAAISLEEGVRQTFDWMKEHWDEVR
ncbi:GDP-L-fucose synthase family protein [Pseudomonadota bacterium]